VESKLILPAYLAHARVVTKKKQASLLERFQDKVAVRLDGFIRNNYRYFVEKSLWNRYTTVAVFFGMLLISIGLVAGNIVRFEFFPNVPSDFIQADLVMNDGVSFEERNAALAKVENAILTLNDDFPDEQPIDHVMVFTSGDDGGGVTVELTKAGDGRTVSAVEIEQHWRDKVGYIANTRELRFSSSTNAGGGAKINLRLTGTQCGQFELAAGELEERLSDYAGVFDVTNSYSRGSEEISLRIKPEAEHLGLTATALGSQVRQAFYGDEAQRLLRGRDELKVMVRYPEDERASIANLEHMRIRTQQGEQIPFGQLSEGQIGAGLARRNLI